MRRRTLLSLALLVLAAAAVGCEQAAELIPGQEPTPAAATPVATPAAPSLTPTPVTTVAPAEASTPLLLPAELQPAADEENAAAGATVASNEDATEPAKDDATEADEADEPDPGEFHAQLARSVVQVLVTDPKRNPPIMRDGSGVVIDVDRGLILTSAHVVDPFEDDGTRSYSEIAIAVSPVPGVEPVVTYRAVLAALDRSSDLAVLRVTGLLAEIGSPPATASSGAGEDGSGATGGAILVLPAAAIGDSGAMTTGDSLLILGHPGLDPSGAVTTQAVTVTDARLMGVRGDSVLGDRAWLKTDAWLPHGYAGAAVFNSAGDLVGIAAQPAYQAAVPIAHVRPLELAAPVIEEARRRGAGSAYVPPLSHPGGVPGTSLAAPGDGIVVSAPQFAAEVIEEDGERNLFDYGRVFSWRTRELQYEFVAQGIPSGAIVQEIWYYYRAFQDHLSSTYRWTSGPFAVVSDLLASPNPSGIPDGVWTLEIWVDGHLRASGRAFVGVWTPSPSVAELRFGSRLSRVEPGKAEPPEVGSPQLLAFFDYQGASTVEYLRWRFLRDGELAYESPDVLWLGGESGTWWVGLPVEDGLRAGNWDVEIWFDDVMLASDGLRLR